MANPTCIFPYNPFLVSMEIQGEVLVVAFKKYKKKYYEVPLSVKYGLFYANEKCVEYYNQNIKNQFKNEKIK